MKRALGGSEPASSPETVPVFWIPWALERGFELGRRPRCSGRFFEGRRKLCEAWILRHGSASFFFDLDLAPALLSPADDSSFFGELPSESVDPAESAPEGPLFL